MIIKPSKQKHRQQQPPSYNVKTGQGVRQVVGTASTKHRKANSLGYKVVGNQNTLTQQ